MSDLILLTRAGCVNAPAMLTSLHAALKALGRPAEYEVVDVTTLSSSDERAGYPTPTLLYRGGDLFGMPAPAPPFDPPG